MTDETGLGFSENELNTSVLLKRCSLRPALQKSVTAVRMSSRIPQQYHTGLHTRRSVHVTVISKSEIICILGVIKFYNSYRVKLFR
jgi:hypothetical protein